MHESYIHFDRAKFKEVVHYICSSVEPAKLGNVKLHRILYFADMLTFLSTSKPLTGADYQRQQFGPTARHLATVITELEREGAIRVDNRDFYGYAKKDYVPLRASNHRLSNAETALIGHVIDFVVRRTASEISDLSHDAAWQAAYPGERIPYASVYGMIPIEVTDEDRQDALSWAESLRSDIEPALHAPNN